MNVEDFVLIFVNKIENCKYKGLFSSDINLCNFPYGCCNDASELLGMFLLKNGIVCEYVNGIYYINGKRQSHGWLEYNDLVIDITSSQFNNDERFLGHHFPKIYVGNRNEFYNLFEDIEKRKFITFSDFNRPVFSLEDLYDIIVNN